MDGQTFFIIVEVLKEDKEFIFVPSKDSFDLRWLLRICDEHLWSSNEDIHQPCFPYEDAISRTMKKGKNEPWTHGTPQTGCSCSYPSTNSSSSSNWLRWQYIGSSRWNLHDRGEFHQGALVIAVWWRSLSIRWVLWMMRRTKYRQRRTETRGWSE